MTDALAQPAAAPLAAPAPFAPANWRLRLSLPSARRSFLLCLAWIAFCLAFAAGVWVRQWAWRSTEHVRFRPDIANAYHWGTRVCTDARTTYSDGPPTWSEFLEGYRAIYDREADSPSGGSMALDYLPLRLLVMSLWVKGILASPTAADGWYWRQTNPLLWFNTLCALAAALGAFAVVRHWTSKPLAPTEPARPRAGIFWGTVASLLVWFDPAVILEAHAWPQWDVWCVPFFIWAVYCASLHRWFTAGLLIATGALLKGQLLIASPVLLLWALVGRGTLLSAARFLLGLACAAGVIASLWLVPTRSALIYVASLTLTGLAAAILLRRLPRTRPLAPYLAALSICVPIWSACWLFGGSLNWAWTGFVMPVDQRQFMSIGATNLPNLLYTRWGFDVFSPVTEQPIRWLGMTEPVSLRQLLRALYAVALLTCGVMAGLHARRGSPRVLVAAVAPWVLFYTLLPQMHERHLMWAAPITAIAVGSAAGTLWLHGLVSAYAFADIFRRMIHRQGGYAEGLDSFLQGISPDVAWLLTLVAAIYLYQACRMERREPATVSVG